MGDKQKVKVKSPKELFPRTDQDGGKCVSLERNVGSLRKMVSVVQKPGTELLKLFLFSVWIKQGQWRDGGSSMVGPGKAYVRTEGHSATGGLAAGDREPPVQATWPSLVPATITE